jgi:uncharacterized protein
MNSYRKLLAARARTVRGCSADGVPSPCLSVCRMDGASGLCEGCFRTLEEIAAWSRMADADKRAVWRLIEERACIGKEPSA